jgi:hypothetical protein
MAPACRRGNVLASAKFPHAGYIFDTQADGLADAITSKQIFNVADVAGLLRRDRDATGTGPERSPFNPTERVPLKSSSLAHGFCS